MTNNPFDFDEWSLFNGSNNWDKNINNSNELSSLIDKYLIPQELDKKES